MRRNLLCKKSQLNRMHRLKPSSNIALAIFFVLAGLNHFLHPDFYVRIMPPYLPWHWFLVY